MRHPAHGERIIDHHDDVLGPQALHRSTLRRQFLPHLGHGAHAMRRIVRRQARCAHVLVRCPLRQRNRIQDQHDFAGTEHSGAGDADHARQLRPDVLHDHLAVAENFIDVYRDPLITALQDDDRRILLRHRRRLTVTEQGRQVIHRHAIAMPQYRTFIVGSRERIGLELLHLFHQHRRYRISLATGRQDHDLRHRQRQRQMDREVRTFAGFRQDFDAATERRGFGSDHVHADAASGQLGDFFRGREAGVENQIGHLGIGQDAVIGQQTGRLGLAADAGQVQPLSVIRELDHDFVAFLAYLDQQFADIGLAAGLAQFARFDAVHDRIAQQMLERARHFFQHAAIDLDRAAAYVQVDTLVDFLRCLARDAEQALGDAGKLHHAHPHQILLQVARQARLRHQIGGRAVDRLGQVLLHRSDVVDAFGHHAGQLLQAREAVELERIEFAIGRMRHARRDLRFGLDFDFAQLVPQAHDVFGQLAEGSADCADVGFEPRTRNRHFTGLIDQAIKNIGTHAHQRHRRCRRRLFDGGRGGKIAAARGHQRTQFDHALPARGVGRLRDRRRRRGRCRRFRNEPGGRRCVVVLRIQ